MAIADERIGVVVVGYGYWGPNIVRNIMERTELRLLGLCELDPQRADKFRARFPGIPVEADLDAILIDPRVDAVMVATPPRTHFGLARRALMAGKHVLVEKPLATTTADAVELIRLAEDRELVLMPGHTFLYSPPVVKVRDLLASGSLGGPYFVTSSRMNLGIYQPDGVICDLAPHDLSILLYWLDKPVVQVSATGRGMFDGDVPDTAFLNLTFACGTVANVQLSWLAPRKMREMVIVGSKRMVRYADLEGDEAIRIYDRGLEREQPEPGTFGEYRLTYRTGDMIAPRIDAAEPLNLELQDFSRAILTGQEPRSNARLGLEIVKALEAAQLSLRLHGQPVRVELADEALALGAQQAA
ncbi:MAG: Gfo/Idh/MocA family oxidoreductase [Actinomycetota bacterium]|nr:Gfo/Idh/MocA family oxidoreductase [Actinomycetota bacterium]